MPLINNDELSWLTALSMIDQEIKAIDQLNQTFTATKPQLDCAAKFKTNDYKKYIRLTDELAMLLEKIGFNENFIKELLSDIPIDKNFATAGANETSILTNDERNIFSLFNGVYNFNFVANQSTGLAMHRNESCEQAMIVIKQKLKDPIRALFCSITDLISTLHAFVSSTQSQMANINTHVNDEDPCVYQGGNDMLVRSMSASASAIVTSHKNIFTALATLENQVHLPTDHQKSHRDIAIEFVQTEMARLSKKIGSDLNKYLKMSFFNYKTNINGSALDTTLNLYNKLDVKERALVDLYNAVYDKKNCSLFEVREKLQFYMEASYIKHTGLWQEPKAIKNAQPVDIRLGDGCDILLKIINTNLVNPATTANKLKPSHQ